MLTRDCAQIGKTSNTSVTASAWGFLFLFVVRRLVRTKNVAQFGHLTAWFVMSFAANGVIRV